MADVPFDFEDRSLPSSDDEGEIQAPLAAKATKISLPKRPNDSNGGNDGPLAKKQKLVKMATLEQLAEIARLEVRIAELTALDEEQKKYINAELAERLAKAEKDAKDWESCARYQRGADEKILTKKLAPLTDPNRDRLFVALQALHMLEPTVSNLSKVVATAIMPGNKPVNKPDDETPPE